MAEQWTNGRSSKEIKNISQRLYAGKSYPPKSKQEVSAEQPKPKVSKEQLEEIVNRLYVEDPYIKRKELSDRFQQQFEVERGENFGFQKKLGNIEILTKRLFVADYVSRHINKNNLSEKVDSGRKLSQREVEASTRRLFVGDYSNRHEVRHKKFYDDLMMKKKSGEKVLSTEEQDGSIARLSNKTRDPAECNKELRGQKTYEEKGILGTYIVIDPAVCIT